jgi:hypothetical protein
MTAFGVTGVLMLECYFITKMDLIETGYDDGWWMHLAQDRVHWRALVL